MYTYIYIFVSFSEFLSSSFTRSSFSLESDIIRYIKTLRPWKMFLLCTEYHNFKISPCFYLVRWCIEFESVTLTFMEFRLLVFIYRRMPVWIGLFTYYNFYMVSYSFRVTQDKVLIKSNNWVSVFYMFV